MPALTRPKDLPQARVIRVIDGDTVEVSPGGRVRQIGMDTPETVDPRQPVQCFGREASVKAQELLGGKTVFLEADPTQGERDRYRRLLRYVWLPDGRLFNLEMIAQGYAHEYTYATPYKYQQLFKQAQRTAREQNRGLWAPQTCAGNTSRPALAATPTPQRRR
jgi:micrococcal nuclease